MWRVCGGCVATPHLTLTCGRRRRGVSRRCWSRRRGRPARRQTRPRRALRDWASRTLPLSRRLLAFGTTSRVDKPHVSLPRRVKFGGARTEPQDFAEGNRKRTRQGAVLERNREPTVVRLSRQFTHAITLHGGIRSRRRGAPRERRCTNNVSTGCSAELHWTTTAPPQTHAARRREAARRRRRQRRGARSSRHLRPRSSSSQSCISPRCSAVRVPSPPLPPG